MKKVIFILSLLVSLFSFTQVTLLSPTGDGGFETGATAAANGWTSTVGTATQNQWIVGSSYAYGGSRGAYITNATSTAPNSYTNSAARVSHLYRNFTLPTNTATATLSFYWKGTGESCCDYLSVYFEPATNAAPTYGTQKALSGTAPTGIVNAANQTTTRTRYNSSFAGYTTSQQITITIPASYFTNTAYRLTFEWRNDGSTGTNPPAAIDNVSITYTVAVTPTITSLGSSSGCVGSNLVINGTNLTGATAANVKIGGTAVTSIASNTGTVLTAVVGSGTTGTVSVTTGGGTATSSSTFTVNPIPTISYVGSPFTYTQNTSITNLTPTTTGTSFSSTLPTGLSINTGTGVISGTPTTTQTAANYTITATANSCTNTTTVSIAVRPSNDVCANATSLPCATSALAGTTVGSISETSPNSLYVGGYGVWYTFTGDGGQTTISVTSSIDLGMYIGYGTCASRTQVVSVDGSGAGGTETYTFTTTNSAVYYVYVAYYGVSVITNTFTISRTCVAPCTTPTTAGTLSSNKTTTTVNDAVVFTTTGNGGTITKFEYSYNNFSTVEGTVNNPANPYTLILNVQQPTMWFRTTSVSGGCPAGVTTPISVTLQSAPEYIYGTEDGDYISNVTLNTINNNSTYDLPLGDSYQDFTSISTTLVKGTNYTIFVSSPTTFLGYQSGYAAWIDYNNDGIFQTTENIMQQSYGTTKSQSFTVPTTASVALVTMRVLSSWAETPTTDAYDVIGYDYGEIEEYKINITSGLPVELYSFDGVNIGNNNYLFWVTTSEQNTSHFNLQKSRDGENWETMMTLSAAGNSNTQIDYDVVDYKVEPIINYYRLQQYDNDGVYETFGPISINNMDLGSQKTIVKYINLNGQEVDPTKLKSMDVYIEVYDDGTMRRVIK